jgi:4-oxalocrotonate tautomerase
VRRDERRQRGRETAEAQPAVSPAGYLAEFLQKRRIVEELTDAMVAIEGEATRPVTWVVVEAVRSGDWGIAGKPLTTQDVRALAAAPA